MDNITFIIQFTLGLYTLSYLLITMYFIIKDFYEDDELRIFIKYKIKSVISSKKEKIKNLKEVGLFLHELTVTGKIQKNFMCQIKNGVSYYDIDDYTLFIVSNNISQRYIIYFVKGVLFFKARSFYFEIKDDDVFISDVKDYQYIMDFYKRLKIYIDG